MSIEIIVAIIGALSGIVGAVVGAGVLLFVNRRQNRLEERKLELERLKLLYGSVPMLGQGPPPEHETPDVFDKEFKAYLQVIDSEEERSTNQVYGLETLPTRQRLGKLGDEHINWARSLWSSNHTPDAYRSAFHYQLAGYCYAKAARPNDAGWQYHFAGHKFRSIFEWERAADCYVWSAEQFQKSSDIEATAVAKRSAMRAIACLKQVEEHQRASKIVEQFEISE